MNGQRHTLPVVQGPAIPGDRALCPATTTAGDVRQPSGPVRPPERPLRRDRGGAAIVVVTVVAVLSLIVLGALAQFGRNTVGRAQAQTAADAAALASLDGGRAAAVSIAARNGGVLLRWGLGPGVGEVTVVVEVGGITATARASDAG